MSELDYVKALLYAYPQMEKMEEALSVSVENKAALSFKDHLSAFESAGLIIEEMAVKLRIARVRSVLERAILHMTERERFLLEYKYFRRRDYLKERSCAFSCSERTYYRNQRTTLLKFAHMLCVYGYREEDFLSDFSDFPSYMRIYRALKEGRESAITAKRTRRPIAFSGGQKSDESSPRLCSVRLPRSTKAAIPTTATQRTQITVICTAESEEVAAGSSCTGGSVAETCSR